MNRVIVTDTQYRMALAPMRTLAKAGWAVTAAAFETTAPGARLGFFSRDARDTLLLPEDGEGFCAALEAAAGDDRPVLLCGNRKSMVLAMANRARLERRLELLLPSEAAMTAADDKGRMYQTALRLGIPAPQTTCLSEHGSLDALERAVRYPCIIKYRNGEALGLKPAARYAVVRGRPAFLDAYARMDRLDPDPIASDYIAGHDLGAAVVMDKACRPVGVLCYESLREYPLAGGPTCALRTVWSPRLAQYACALLQEIGFTGLAMLDFRGTPEQPWFLEINPRVWGSAMIAPLSGSPLFLRYAEAARGTAVPLEPDRLAPDYQVGRQMRFTPQSLACFAALMKRPGRGAALAASLKSALDPRVRDGLFTWRDPLPYLHYLADLLRRRA